MQQQQPNTITTASPTYLMTYYCPSYCCCYNYYHPTTTTMYAPSIPSPHCMRFAATHSRTFQLAGRGDILGGCERGEGGIGKEWCRDGMKEPRTVLRKLD